MNRLLIAAAVMAATAGGAAACIPYPCDWDKRDYLDAAKGGVPEDERAAWADAYCHEKGSAIPNGKRLHNRFCDSVKHPDAGGCEIAYSGGKLKWTRQCEGAGASNADCERASFVFGKMSVAAVQCNLPASGPVMKFLRVVDSVAIQVCGADVSHWPGVVDGGKAFLAEVDAKGRDAVCSRISSEMMAAGLSGK